MMKDIRVEIKGRIFDSLNHLTLLLICCKITEFSQDYLNVRPHLLASIILLIKCISVTILSEYRYVHPCKNM